MQTLKIKGNLYDPAVLGAAEYERALMSTLFNKRTLTQRPELMVQPQDIEDVITRK